MSAQIVRLSSMAKNTTIGLYLKSWRESKQMSQRELAQELGINQTGIVFVEQDKYDYPVAFLRKLKPLMTKKEYETAKALFHSKLEAELE